MWFTFLITVHKQSNISQVNKVSSIFKVKDKISNDLVSNIWIRNNEYLKINLETEFSSVGAAQCRLVQKRRINVGG